MFNDRVDAGRRLARRLESYEGMPGAVVLGVPRGGIPVAAEVARALRLPLEPFFVKKIGHPQAPEVAIGAVGLSASCVDEDWALRRGACREYVAEETERVQRELRRRYAAYRGQTRPRPLRGAVVLLVDDGAATGLTLELAVRLLRAEGAARVVVAVPVASPGAAALLGRTADEFVRLAEPEDFLAIGEYYRDFSQVPDQTAMRLLEERPAPSR